MFEPLQDEQEVISSVPCGKSSASASPGKKETRSFRISLQLWRISRKGRSAASVPGGTNGVADANKYRPAAELYNTAEGVRREVLLQQTAHFPGDLLLHPGFVRIGADCFREALGDQ